MTDEEKREGWRTHSRWPGPRGLRIAGMVLAGIAFAAVFALAFGWLVMILWNWIMPPIFHLTEIGYWQGFGILLLAKIIFATGNRGPRGGPWRGPPWRWGPWHRGGWHEDKDWWRYAHDFWKEEGREAFERFMDRRKAGGAATPETKEA